MKSFSSIDLYFFIKEQQEELKGSRIETFYHNDVNFYIRTYIKGKGNLFLTVGIGSYVYLTPQKSQAPLHPTSFVSYLRKYLKNSFIESIEQVGLERVMKLVISKKTDEIITTYHLYIEVFSGGNIILCDQNDIILNSLIKKTYKDRTVRNKHPYELPPTKGINPLVIGEKELEEIVRNSDLSLVKFFALLCGMGGKYAEEICSDMGVDKNSLAKEISPSRLLNEFEKFFSKSLSPCVIKKEKTILDFFPFIPSNETLVCEKQESFNFCLEQYYLQFLEKEDVRDVEFEKKKKKLEKRIEKQEEQKLDVLRNSDEYSLKGEKIYEHYAQLDEILQGILSASKEKGWDHVLQVIENNPELQKIIEKLDYKHNKIIVNLQ